MELTFHSIRRDVYERYCLALVYQLSTVNIKSQDTAPMWKFRKYKKANGNASVFWKYTKQDEKKIGIFKVNDDRIISAKREKNRRGARLILGKY